MLLKIKKHKLLLPVFLILTITLYINLQHSAANEKLYGVNENGTLLIPIRGVVEQLGGSVDYEHIDRKVTIKNEIVEIILFIDNKNAVLNGNTVELRTAPKIINDRTHIPLRFVSEKLGADVDWQQEYNRAVIKMGSKVIYVYSKPVSAGSIDVSRAASNAGDSRSVKHYSKRYGNTNVNVVEIPPNTLKAGVVLAHDNISSVEELASMASRSGAVVAINGTFFEAYGGIPEPWNNIMKDGQWVNVGSIGTTIGFTSAGEVKMAPIKIKIKGAVNGNYNWPDNWYAYGFNRTPDPNGSGVYIYNRARGNNLGFAYGVSVIVENGVVTGRKYYEDVFIPYNGFVINFTGSEKYLTEEFFLTADRSKRHMRFKLGDRVEYKVEFENTEGQNWHDVVNAVGAGPRLVKNGQISVNPIAEGFTEPKITELATARSAIGVKSDGTIILLTANSATVYKLAEIMHDLGAYNAMNLDGGASSGLWLKGKYITKPGRLINNALIFY